MCPLEDLEFGVCVTAVRDGGCGNGRSRSYEELDDVQRPVDRLRAKDPREPVRTKILPAALPSSPAAAAPLSLGSRRTAPRCRALDCVAHVGEAGDVGEGALEAEAEAAVRYRAVAAHIAVSGRSAPSRCGTRPCAHPAPRAAPRAGCRRLRRVGRSVRIANSDGIIAIMACDPRPSRCPERGVRRARGEQRYLIST